MLISNKKRWLIIGSCIAAAALLIVIIIAISVSNQEETTDEENLVLVEERKTTPALEIYALLPEETTIARLDEIAKTISQDYTIIVYQNNVGQLEVPGQPGVIIFDYGLNNTEENTTAIDEESDEESSSEEIIIDTEDDFYADTAVSTIEHQPNGLVKNIRYIYQIGDDHYSISYSNENKYYEVFDLNEVFDFDSKAKAIAAFLSPVVRWEE